MKPKRKLKPAAKFLIAALIGLGVFMAIRYFMPEKTDASQTLASLQVEGDVIDSKSEAVELPLPKSNLSSSFNSSRVIRVAEYAWNGNSGMIVANGGPKTTEGSLIEAAGLSLEIVRQDMVGGLRDMQIKFVEEFDGGAQYPRSDKSAPMVSIMGDGVPFYVTTLQKSLDEKFGKGKYHAQCIGAIGLSYGEDKLIGPRDWKDNPQTMKGAVVSSVLGDGDWVVACNYAFANGIPVNPDPTTYDPEALNFVASENDDYINSVKELIKSQNAGYTVTLKEVKGGKLTGKTVSRKIDGATTWTPGDQIAFDALVGFTDVASTKDFVNQMATSIITIKEWAIAHDKEIISLLKNTYIATNQIKQYDRWARKAAECVAKTYDYKDGAYWYSMFKGQKGTKAGLTFNVGGTKVFTYADAMKYYGISDGNNRYKAVYDQVSFYLTKLNPFGFNQSNPDGVVPFDDAVNLYFLKSIKGLDAGNTETISYAETKTNVMAEGQWNINFATASANIVGSQDELETIYNLLMQAEDAKLRIIGHTDNVGNPQSNLALSKSRANAVVEYLVNKGISKDRIQEVDGRGDSEPVASNATAAGKAKNRRVDITLLN
jgi:outer membrane protein OmpA-like peptidoglycan-associated protein